MDENKNENPIVDFGFNNENSIYLKRGKEWIGTSATNRIDMLSHFRLDVSLNAMNNVNFPDFCKHLLKGLGLSNSYGDLKFEYGTNLSLLTVLNERAFGRPIEPLPNHLIENGFQFPIHVGINGTKLLKIENKKRSNFIHSPPLLNDTENKNKDEKKKEKKKKRERQESENLKLIFEPLINELKSMTWNKWLDKNGKPSNPFLIKITKENCKSLFVPNYFDYIKIPMDLTRINEKLQKFEYIKLEEIENDILLLVNNAKLYNRQGEPVYQMAIDFKNIFDEKIKNIYKPIYDEINIERKKQKKEKKKKKDKKKEK